MPAFGKVASIQRSVLRRLPKLLRKALNDYAVFAVTSPPEDPKGFSAHQAACKSALAHLDTAAKLLAWAEDPATVSGDRDDLARMIEAAEHAIAGTDPDDL